MPTLVPCLRPRLRSRLAIRFARRSKERQDIYLRYGASWEPSIRLASRHVTALSRLSDGLISTSAHSAPYNLELRSRSSVITIMVLLKCNPGVYRKKTQRARVPAVPPLFAHPSQEEPYQVQTYPCAITGVPGYPYSTLVVFQSAARKGNSEHRPPLPCTTRQLS